ncbi:MAG: hypothetical protein WCZ65_11825 [Lysobacteraceae bacterium]
MQFNVRLDARGVDVDAIERRLQDLDPSAFVDIEPGGNRLRVSGVVSEDELLSVMGAAGYPLAADRIEPIPSLCCGGCGG